MDQQGFPQTRPIVVSSYAHHQPRQRSCLLVPIGQLLRSAMWTRSHHQARMIEAVGTCQRLTCSSLEGDWPSTGPGQTTAPACHHIAVPRFPGARGDATCACRSVDGFGTISARVVSKGQRGHGARGCLSGLGRVLCISRPVTYLNLFLVERDALDDVETRRLVRFWVCVVCRLENCLVFCTVYQEARIWSAIGRHAASSNALGWSSSSSFFWGVFHLPTYAVLFLLPFGCLSNELLWKDESGSAFSGVSSIWTAESALLCGELANSCELVGAATGDGG